MQLWKKINAFPKNVMIILFISDGKIYNGL